LIQHDVIDEIICCDKEIPDKKLVELIALCHELGVTFRIQSITAINVPFKTRIQYFEQTPFFTIETTPVIRYTQALKTILETATAFAILFSLSPLLLVISLIIAATSRGPIIFKQQRVGLRGRKFYIYKFRTMVHNAEALKTRLESKNESDGPVFKIKNDPRITAIGRVLRLTNLDEIPQLFNVLKGEMSIIGPRPPLPAEVAQYQRWQLKRLAVKPGLTCTWQIEPDRNSIQFDQWMLLDIQYIENWSLQNDILLFFKTLKTVFLARGC
jgi:lipopolysaccharide/colanic/teichoic acid biosynthesis glycosyltransferase